MNNTNTQNAMKYRYYTYGMFTGTDGNRYDICIPSPFIRDSRAEAMKDENFAYRFWAIDSAGPMLVAFANEHFKHVNNGKMQLRYWVNKVIVGTYTFEEFKKNGGYIRQLKPSSKKGICYKIKVMINTRVRFFVHFHAFVARYLCWAVRATISSDEKDEQPYDLPATSRWVFFFLYWQQPKEEGAAQWNAYSRTS